MLNRFEGIGRLTKDVEVTTTKQGKRVARFTVAIDRGKDSQGQSLGADFVPCSAFEQQADFLSKYFHKGEALYVEGRLRIEKIGERTYSGITVSAVQFLPQNKRAEETQTEYTYTRPAIEPYPDEDKLPF